ncbi:phosphatidylethanolamine-binding protein [Pseudomassariella vexata]|uniref:Large ribosomal subunit protein mL38 n=1 Tax=Pseudomassariella vexata TaxID=1141098 RepID=A0A1Y2EKY4_9PEZI|nr:phosphatidylethanolamine-binding protein [Pseudomassariella vexata]ORY71956.1 phosphatidylethanolamine-binding protein [Pseudomassariella vexata]
MSSCQRVARPLARSLRQDRLIQTSSLAIRSFSQSVARRDETTTTTTPPSEVPSSSAEQPKARKRLDPETTTEYWSERKLSRMGTPPVGSRRRRAAIKTSENIPFEQLPYQCFQEARNILQQDRKEKLEDIVAELAKIRRLEATPADQLPGGERKKNLRLASLRKYVEELKILADINDPVVKRRFEDGLGDMNKPIYRFLAQRKWKGYPFRHVTQRIQQLNIVPDVLPKFEPTADVQLFFRRTKVETGEILNSLKTEVPPRLKVQVFDAGERLVSVVVMDSDVPNAETDSFERRCHYLAANVPIAPAQQSLPLGRVNQKTQLAVPYLPAFSQKGAPYHRLSVWVLQQKPGQTLDIVQLRGLYSRRDGFSLKSFRDKFELNPIGFSLFRTVWDENTAAVMERAGIPGADIEFKHKRVYSLKEEKKPRGWEAKRQGPKYKSLWKYTKRIRGQPRR